MNIIESIESANYVATDSQIEQLANQATLGVTATGTYLKALVATAQAELKAKRRGEAVHSRYYAAVLRGVGPASVEMEERVRRATFARTSATTLRRYLEGGGHLRTLSPHEVTKGMLRKAVAPPEPTDRIERAFKRAHDAVLRAFHRAAKRDLPTAREQLVLLLEELHAELDSETATHIVTTSGLRKIPHHRDDAHPSL